jgi:hypothetical protein
MFDYKPEIYTDYVHDPDIGWLATAFEPFKSNPAYNWANRPKGIRKDAWKVQKARSAPPIPKKPEVIKHMMKKIWQFAEPTAGAQRGNFVIGTRGGLNSAFAPNPTYSPQQRPSTGSITKFWDNAPEIADDWKLFRHIDRINAVTFRGDSRPPSIVIGQCCGFYPPNTRTDRYYLENNIYKGFADYLLRRYQFKLEQDKFLKAIDSAAPSPEDQRMLIDYMTWRQIMERESTHLGRMVDNELLKGYISTTPSIDTSIQFATSGDDFTKSWIYIVVVHGGFIVPFTPNKSIVWGSGEGEIAQLGPIPADRIVAFARITKKYGPVDEPFFIRPEFRRKEPKAFQYLFNVWSGMAPH